LFSLISPNSKNSEKIIFLPPTTADKDGQVIHHRGTESTEIIFFLLAGDAAERKPLGPSGIKNKG
jgi:hypothetical protein